MKLKELESTLGFTESKNQKFIGKNAVRLDYKCGKFIFDSVAFIDKDEVINLRIVANSIFDNNELKALENYDADFCRYYDKIHYAGIRLTDFKLGRKAEDDEICQMVNDFNFAEALLEEQLNIPLNVYEYDGEKFVLLKTDIGEWNKEVKGWKKGVFEINDEDIMEFTKKGKVNIIKLKKD